MTSNVSSSATPLIKRLALCADDFGSSNAVDGGILRLAAAQRLKAVSCIVTLPHWPGALRDLAALPAVPAGHVQLGLHFNLTEGRPLSAALRGHWPQLPTLKRLLLLAHLRRLPLPALHEELRAQLARFEAARGAAPEHLDGHQHVIHLPGLRDLMLAEKALRPAVRVRHTGHVLGPGFTLKRQLIASTGGRALGRSLAARKVAANTALLGVYDFVHTDYLALMQRWLAAAPSQGGLLFCHPGEADSTDGTDNTTRDPIAAARVRELAYLSGPDFADDLRSAGVVLAGPAIRSRRPRVG